MGLGDIVGSNRSHSSAGRPITAPNADSGWGELVRQLEYKGAWAGRQVVTIDRWFPSSKRRSGCGFVMDLVPLSVRSWVCPQCKAEHDRDVNAALNIKAAGLAVLALGPNVSGRGHKLGIPSFRGIVNMACLPAARCDQN